MTEKQIKQKLRCLYKGWSLSGLTEQDQDIEFNKLLEQLTIHSVVDSCDKKECEHEGGKIDGLCCECWGS